MREVHYRRLDEEDRELIRSYMTQDELWERISEDGCNKDEYTPPMHELFHWVGMYNNKDEFMGTLFLHPETMHVVNIHFNLSKKYRKLYSFLGGQAAFDYMLNCTDFEKFNTTVPLEYPDVVGFLDKLGFTREGLNRKSISKNNIMHDQYYYGMTREEMKNKLTEFTKGEL